MAMGVGIHGKVRWYQKSGTLDDCLSQVLKDDCCGYNVTTDILALERRSMIEEIANTVAAQPHLLWWEHQVQRYAQEYNRLSSKYWTATMTDEWKKWKCRGTPNEQDEHRYICSVWYQHGRAAIRPPPDHID
jgi:hypothetical protein